MIGFPMDPSDAFGEIIEQGQQTTTNTIKSAVSDVKSSVSDQVGFKNKNTNGQANVQGQPQDQQSQQPGEQSQSPQATAEEAQRTKDMVSDFYAPSTDTPANITKQQDEATAQKKLVELRKKLHDEVYYIPLTNPRKTEEERPAERVERQEKQEMQDLQTQQAEKPPPLDIQRAQKIERYPGAGG